MEIIGLDDDSAREKADGGLTFKRKCDRMGVVASEDAGNFDGGSGRPGSGYKGNFQRNLGADGGDFDDDFEGTRLITDLKQGVKNPNRVNVFVNEKFAFSLDLTQVVDFHLKIGTELDAEKIAELRRASEFGKLYQRALEWVLARPRSERETRDYLYRKMSRPVVKRSPARGAGVMSSARGVEAVSPSQEAGTVPPVREVNVVLPVREVEAPKMSREEMAEFSDAIVERLKERGYLDDRRFAEFWVENRFVKKGASSKRLQMELMKKGVAKEVIEEVLQGSERNDKEEMRKIIAKKRAKYTRVNEAGEVEYDDEKMIAYLCRQGFSYEAAREAVTESD